MEEMRVLKSNRRFFLAMVVVSCLVFGAYAATAVVGGWSFGEWNYLFIGVAIPLLAFDICSLVLILWYNRKIKQLRRPS